MGPGSSPSPSETAELLASWPAMTWGSRQRYRRGQECLRGALPVSERPGERRVPWCWPLCHPKIATTPAFTVEQMNRGKNSFYKTGFVPQPQSRDEHLDLILSESQMKPKIFFWTRLVHVTDLSLSAGGKGTEPSHSCPQPSVTGETVLRFSSPLHVQAPVACGKHSDKG